MMAWKGLFGILLLVGAPAWAQKTENTSTEWGEVFTLAPGVDLSQVDYMKGYTPTVVTTEKEARFLSKRMRAAINPKSQCFNRAEVWAYELSEKYENEYSKPFQMVKIFRFFSESYRTANKYDWWFHVAPAFFVEEMKDSKAFTRDQLFVLDKRAYREAVPFQDWNRYFFNYTNKVVSKGCRQVRNYYEYTQLRDSKDEDCFDLVVPMYYYTPDDFAAVEKYGKAYPEMKWHDDDENLNRAYQQAFFGNRKNFK